MFPNKTRVHIKISIPNKSVTCRNMTEYRVDLISFNSIIVFPAINLPLTLK